MHDRNRPLTWLVTATIALAASACGTTGGDVAKSDSREVPGGVAPTTVAPGSGSSRKVPTTSTTSGSEGDTKPDSTTTTTLPESAAVNRACRPGAGRTVEDLPDLEIEAVQVPAFDSPDEKIGDTVIPGVHIPAVELPAQRVEGGCVVRYDAPGGCLGAVEITGANVPDGALPGAALPPVTADGKTLFAGDRAAGDTAEGDVTKGDRVEQACRVMSSDKYQSAVSRAAASRAALSRAALSRGALSRPQICADGDDGKECTESIYVDSVYVDSVYVDSVYVESEYLPSEYLEDAPQTSVLTGDAEKAYVTPAAVLFDFDKADLKPGAVPTLQAIADQISDLPAGAKVRVDGHTDDKGTDAYNDELSARRAEAVATWLKTEGGVPADAVTTKGYGESTPVAPNDSEPNRAANRRVVITAAEA